MTPITLDLSLPADRERLTDAIRDAIGDHVRVASSQSLPETPAFVEKVERPVRDPQPGDRVKFPHDEDAAIYYGVLIAINDGRAIVSCNRINVGLDIVVIEAGKVALA
jgi:hypothetical protein